MPAVLALLLMAAAQEAPPDPPAAFWPAPTPPPPPAPPTGRPFALLLGAALGATDQVERRPNGLAALEVGVLLPPGALRAGLLGTMGQRRDALAWSVSLLLGRETGRTGLGPAEAYLELGLQGYWRRGTQSITRTTEVSGGDAALPMLGLRLQLGPAREPSGFALGLFVQQTLGSATETYQVTTCHLLSGCTTEDRVARYGGFAAGVTLGVAFIGRTRDAPPAAEPAP